MHNLAAFLFLIPLLGTMTPALFLPPWSTPQELAKKCTFTLWHKQVLTATKTNYIQLNQIYDHTNSIVIDVVDFIPVTAHNSYSRISATQTFAVEGLLDSTNLTIKGEDGSDEVRCEHDGIWFSTGKSKKEAWCIPEPWDNNMGIWSGTRVRLRLLGLLWVLIVIRNGSCNVHSRVK
jgi:hypothetical protein